MTPVAGAHASRPPATPSKGGNGKKPRRASLPKGVEPGSLDLETALRLLALPRTLAALLETGQQADGTIILPEALSEYMGTHRIAG